MGSAAEEIRHLWLHGPDLIGMAREPVAMDFMGLGLGESRSEHNVGSERGTLVKPIPTVPEKQGMASVSKSLNTSENKRAAGRENSIRSLRQGARSIQILYGKPSIVCCVGGCASRHLLKVTLKVPGYVCF